jgi:hypothetical protein
MAITCLLETVGEISLRVVDKDSYRAGVHVCLPVTPLPQGWAPLSPGAYGFESS